MDYSNIGKFIKEKRLRKKVSLNEFALNNGIESASLSRIENLKQGIKLNTLSKIAKGFNQKASDLLLEYENSNF